MLDYSIIKKFWSHRNESNFLWRPELTRLSIELIKKYISPNKKILDLGAGDGKISAALSKMWCNVLAVDYVADFISKIDNIRYEVCDIKEFTSSETFDVIILFGVATYLEDEDLFNIYAKSYKMLKPGGYLLVKHQCGIDETKVVTGYSEQLQTEYQAKYRHIDKDIQILTTSGFKVVAQNAYPPEFNKWPDTKFMFFIASKS